MRFIRFTVWLALFVLFVVVLWQNMAQIDIPLNLKFTAFEKEYFNITYPIYVFLLGFFILGSLLAMLYFFTDKLRLGGQLSSCRSRVRALEKEVEQLRSIPLDDTPPAAAAAVTSSTSSTEAETPSMDTSEEKKDGKE
jgi:uncharacterized integral membrane protein